MYPPTPPTHEGISGQRMRAMCAKNQSFLYKKNMEGCSGKLAKGGNRWFCQGWESFACARSVQSVRRSQARRA